MEFKISSSVSQIPASSLFNDGFELSDQTIIPSEDIAGSFSPEENKVELFIYDVNTSLLDSVYDYNGWTITQNSDTSESGNTDTLQIDPSNDLIKRGYDVGDLYAVYNFINYELATSPTDLLYISEISSDRTEIKLNSNFTSNEDLELTFEILQSKVDNADFFDEFYIASEGNNYNIGINLLLDTSTDQYSILIKLYDALPDSFSLKDEVYVATKVAETQAYEVKFFNDSSLDIDDTPYLRGPNYNLEIKDFVNNSTELKSKSELLDAVTTGSNNNLQNILNQKGVKITPNYSFSTFNEFVNFSSAKERIRNFYEKVSQIQSYEDDITTINSSITGSTSGSAQVSSSLSSANSNIENIIKNFDGYEYHLFYTSGSSAYPKISGSDFPHPLQNTGSTEVLQWLGSDVEGSATYGGIILSASLYDNNNQNWLYYTIPEFIRDNPDNNNYIDFSNMVGQHFDEIWLYTKAVTEKNNTTNELDKGIPLKLSQDAIKSLGYEGFGNNFNNQNNYIGLIGEEDGSFVPPTGNEIIDNYIAINNGTVVNYWSPAYSFLFYVEQLGEPGFPYPIDKVSKEIYKRLYHNMAYLVKKKGTVSGLRQLINIWGIPDTILRINEFGGKNKDNTDDYDYWYNRYSYAFSPIANQNYASASAVIPWMPLERNRVTNNEYIVPDNLQFRFKTSGYPSSSYAGEFFSQSLAVKKSDGDETSTNFDFGVGLFYTGSAVGSYSGSNDDTYKNWGVMRFYISGSSSEGGTVVSDDIYLPFYDNGWWSVMLQRDTHPSASVHTTDTNYTLYVKNKTYNGKDRNQIAFQGSASILINGSTSSSINEAWNKFGTGSHDGVYLGGLVSGSNVGPNTLNPSGKIFSGSFQEFRYYSNDIPETVFNDFVMNPESIEGNNITGLESSFDIVNFRAPLGNELEDKFETSISSSHTESFTSFHPAVSAKSTLLITGSFVNPDGNVTSSNYHIRYYENSTTRTFSQPNTEVYFLDQPSIGVRNRISNKIEIDDADDFGTVLSNQISIEQDYEISRSYTEDITSLEVAFSPQDNVNDDIIQAFGYGVVSDALADPRFISSSDDYYPRLREAAEYFFQKYTEGNIYDYIRLIKYVDNSLFKAIKAYVPARTSVSTGIVIKQHMLERNRFTPPSITNKTTVALYPNHFNTPLIFENLELTSSIDVSEIKGEAGGVVNKFNYTGSPSFGETPITQSYNNTFDTPFGLQTIVEDTQKEFYDGEYSGSNVITTTQSLFDNPFKTLSELPTSSNFDNSIYNATINNFNLNRPNSFLQNVDYSTNAVTPVNLNLITGGLAIKVNTPDSNYTMRRITRPRYEGSRLQSADYNFPTNSSSSIIFLNGDSGSYSGDKSFGNTAVVDSHPIYMAHFKSSKENYELWDSYTFNVDALIQLPFEDITGKELTTSIPSIIKIDGSNDNLYDITRTFDKNRKALISYDNFTLGSVNLNSLPVGSNQIYQGGLEYDLIIGSEISKTEFNSTQSYTTASWYNVKNTHHDGSSTVESFTDFTLQDPELITTDTYNFYISYSCYMSTSSKDLTIDNFGNFQPFDLNPFNGEDDVLVNNNDNIGMIFLKGSQITISQSVGGLLDTADSSKDNPDSWKSISYAGNSLAILNTINTNVKNKKYLEYSGSIDLITEQGGSSSVPVFRYFEPSKGVNIGYLPTSSFNGPYGGLNTTPNHFLSRTQSNFGLPLPPEIISATSGGGANKALFGEFSGDSGARINIKSALNTVTGNYELTNVTITNPGSGYIEGEALYLPEYSFVGYPYPSLILLQSKTDDFSTGIIYPPKTLNKSDYDIKDNSKYTYFNISESLGEGYQNPNLPFTIEEGDELRIVYNTIIPSGSVTDTSTPAPYIPLNPTAYESEYVTQDFQILKVGNSVNTEEFAQTQLGKLSTYTNDLLSSITTNTITGNNGTYIGVALTGGSGTGAEATVIVTTTSTPSFIPKKQVTGITITNPGLNYVAGDTLTIPSSVIGGITNVSILLDNEDILGVKFFKELPVFNVASFLYSYPNTFSIFGNSQFYNGTVHGFYNVISKNIYGINNKRDALIVSPNPKTLPKPIPDGKILHFSIRRRVGADDRIIVFQTPPINSEGAKTPTGPGFLLPDDLTPQQKRNALTLISQLKGTNTFD